jgi:hypothetical protein
LSRGGETLMSRRVYRMQQTPSSADDMTTLTAMKIVLAPGAMLAGHFSPRGDIVLGISALPALLLVGAESPAA